MQNHLHGRDVGGDPANRVERLARRVGESQYRGSMLVFDETFDRLRRRSGDIRHGRLRPLLERTTPDQK
jgi:hypothetical protein